LFSHCFFLSGFTELQRAKAVLDTYNAKAENIKAFIHSVSFVSFIMITSFCFQIEVTALFAVWMFNAVKYELFKARYDSALEDAKKNEEALLKKVCFCSSFLHFFIL
jgi:hypothetical protein